ncbi:hypothetical protein Fmac_020932 [Flemingia macrophylla]|uniref:AAA+ ATPase domain-containing protein n=1 Tax=Flemingia macrophylla TaxID=520843 RepID=A0ABD1LVG6_9FABA
MRKRGSSQTLLRRVEAMYPANMHPTTDEVVERIRSTYPDYSRIKHQALFRSVQSVLQSTRKRGRDSEERLQTTSESDVDNGTLSFDLTKTMLRNAYLGMQENNVELESGMTASVVNEGGVKVKCVGKRFKGSLSTNNPNGDDDANVKGIMFRDLGGIKKIRKELDMLLLTFYHPQVARDLGMSTTSGILLHGPPGCGKTRLAHAIANQTGFPFYHISPGQVVSGISGESEQNIRDIFSKAHKTAPSIIFIDEIDAIASKREDLTREMEKRIVTQLLISMDQPNNDNRVLVIGATNRPDAIDPALRRPGRFDREIYIGMPDESAREEILSVLTHNVKLRGPIDLLKIAKSTSAFVASDLKSVISHAGSLAMKRIICERYTTTEPPEECFSESWSPEEVEKVAITMSDLEEAVKMVQPSERRAVGLSPIPDVKWDDIGGLDLLRNEFDDYIIAPIKCPGDYEDFCFMDHQVKTPVVKAVANAAGVSFIHIKLDALTTTRGKGKEGASVTDRVLNQLLIELDGAEQRKDVFVIGATNRPEVIDPALLRPGRLGRLLYVPLPSPEQRVLILKNLARKHPVDVGMDLSAIGRSEACENMSGADLALLMEEAVMAAVKKYRTSSNGKEKAIKPWHMEEALTRVFPSVSDKQKQHYQRLS